MGIEPHLARSAIVPEHLEPHSQKHIRTRSGVVSSWSIYAHSCRLLMRDALPAKVFSALVAPLPVCFTSLGG